MKRRALLLIAMLLGLAAQAIPVRHPFMTLTQPDGYSFTVRQIGDEWLHIAMTLDGAAVIKGEDDTP